MAEYQVNKGADGRVEFQGLTSHYLFIFVGGLLGIFLLFVLMFMGGVPQGICIAATFRLSRRYGPNGLMKLLAARQHPRRIIHRRSIRRLLNLKKR